MPERDPWETSAAHDPWEAAAPPPAGPAERFGKGLLSTTVEPAMATAPELGTARGALGLTLGPGGNVILGLLQHSAQKIQEAYEAGKAGKDWTEVAKNLIQATPAAAMVQPVVGPLSEGNIAGAAGAATGLAATAALPKILPPAARVAGRAAGAAKEAVMAPGTGRMLSGASEALGGAAVTAKGSPYGPIMMGRGAGRFLEGLSTRRSAINAKLAAATGTGVEAADVALLDKIAQGQAGKKFAKLSPDEQQAVRSLAERVKGTPAPSERPSVDPAMPVAPVEAAQVEPLPESHQIEAPPGRGVGPILTPPPPDTSGVRAVEPRRMVVRDPSTGRMKRVYTGEDAAAGPTIYQEARPGIETAPAVSTAPLPRAETLKPEVAATLEAGATRVGPKGRVEVLRSVPIENIQPAEATAERPQGNVIYPEIVRKYQGKPSPVAPELRGNEAEGYTTWEGHHRIEAAKANGAKSILAWTPAEEGAGPAAGIPRESAAIKAHGYDPATQTANVEFQSGGSYRFPDFTPERYAAFEKSESKGQYFQKMIRNQYTRVGTRAGQPVMERNSTRLARFLNAAGISAEDAPQMGPDHWKTAAKAAGVKEPSPAIVKEAIGRLKELPTGSVAVEEFQSR